MFMSHEINKYEIHTNLTDFIIRPISLCEEIMLTRILALGVLSLVLALVAVAQKFSS